MNGATGLALDFDLGGAVGILPCRLACSRPVKTLFEEIGHFQAQISSICRIGQTGFEIDDPGANEPFNLAIEVLHTLGAAIAHGIEKRLALGFAFFNVDRKSVV